MTRGDNTATFTNAVERIRNGADALAEVEDILRRLTPDEQLSLLDGDQDFWAGMTEMMAAYNTRPIIMGEVARLGIPGLRFSDGPRGAVVGESTAFPVSMARGATWDVALEERVGVVIGSEIRAQGANFFGGVCINLPRHPAWGRAQETYGEDPLLLGEFGAALIRGIRRNAMAVAKHFALNSMENARFTVDVTVDDAALHEVYLPHFRRAVEAGVDGIMTAYNSVNGEWAGQNEVLMEGILRGQWGFEGVTVSDFVFGLRDAGLSLTAGLDVEEPFRQQRAEHLPDDLASGRVAWEHVDRAARRILRTQLVHAASVLEDAPSAGVVFSPEHRALAREVAQRSMVLLKNIPVGGAPVLPLRPEALTRVALIGRLADVPTTGDHGSSDVRSPEVATALDGLRAALPQARIDVVDDDDPVAAAAAAATADVAVVVAGYTAADEGENLSIDPSVFSLFPPAPEEAPAFARDGELAMGEWVGGDRANLRLRPVDEDIILATVRANPRTVVVLVTAGAVVTEAWRHEAPAILVSWYSGCEGGNALADVLTGAVDASGRLPYSVPTSEDHLPFFDRDATSIVYDRWYGQRLLDRDGNAAAYPLGFGLSYTSFMIDSIEVSDITGESFAARVHVTNTGDRDGRHAVQIYAEADADDFPRRVLVGFATVDLAAGDDGVVTVECSTRPLQKWGDGGFSYVSGEARICASAYSGDPNSVATALRLPS